jgi:predicted acylesterase/phospholipase RssA
MDKKLNQDVMETNKNSDENIIIVSSDNENETQIIDDVNIIMSTSSEKVEDIKKEQFILQTEPKYKNLVLSGGSTRGISEIGAVKKLIDDNLLDLKKLKAVAGTSAGSMFGLLIVLGFTVDEIWNFIYWLDMEKLVDPDFFMFLKKCGVETGRIIYNFFEDILTKKTGIKHINFKQLYEITKIHFTVVGSCLTTKKAVYYDHINTPNFKVSMAIRISIGMPGFFTPVVINNNKYIDGGVINNYPMNLFADKLDETIGILIRNDYSTVYEYPEEYFMAVINLFLHQYFEKMVEKYSENTISIEEKSDNRSIFNFSIDNETKIRLFDTGVEAAKKFIEKLSTNNKIIIEDF